MLQDFISQQFANNVGLTQAEIFEANLSLADILEQSEQLHNSIDLMEAFAKTANGLKKEYGIQVRLPALALETPISEVLDVFLVEANQKTAA